MRCKGRISSKSLYMLILLLDGSSSIFSRVAAPSYIAQPDQAHSLAPFKFLSSHSAWATPSIPHVHLYEHDTRLVGLHFEAAQTSTLQDDYRNRV
ncbi:uncharacterized protein EV420DRAFT_1545327 [Desarmillaria tabescens]|uniref:Secreted protein n=1 Tax=Armillaria tabescens TaxID=1929756 RepID=A0AA39N4T9_ARMTA|nr:uncharacterized protein EV420DRAFT_1545327 [Desarmillaria tabescens]KAK0457922.1 hypothetical protein EV420DRAFT_1545327 [Desarmillaria tabescens]